MDPKISDIALRIRSLRADSGFSLEEMANATDTSAEEYERAESGEHDFSFTFLYKCAEKLGVDMIDLLTGGAPHLTGYSVVRSGTGLPIRRRQGFEYQHLAPTFRNKLAEPFLVTAPFSAEEQDKQISLSYHDGQEMDYILEGTLRFVYEEHVEELKPGDTVFYDSGRGHGMIATGGAPCTFLAIVLKHPESEEMDQ